MLPMYWGDFRKKSYRCIILTPKMIAPLYDQARWGARRAMSLGEPFLPPLLTPSPMQELRLAASKMTGAARRAVQAERTLPSWRGSARLAEPL